MNAKNAAIIKRITFSILIAAFALIIIYFATIMFNKAFNRDYDSASETDKQLFSTVSQAVDEMKASASYPAASFTTPTLFVEKGTVRGSAFLYNLPVTEYSGGFWGFNMGMYAQEILLPESMCQNVLSPYRMSIFTPGLSSVMFPSQPANTVTKLVFLNQTIDVIYYDKASLQDGSTAAVFSGLLTSQQTTGFDMGIQGDAATDTSAPMGTEELNVPESLSPDTTGDTETTPDEAAPVTPAVTQAP